MKGEQPPRPIGEAYPAGLLETLLEESTSLDSGGGHGCGLAGGFTQEEMRSLAPAQREQLLKELRELLKSLPRSLYEELRKHYLGEVPPAPERQASIGLGTAGFTEADDQTVTYYMDAARAYGIIIAPREACAMDIAEIESGKREWMPGDDARRLDVSRSGGKILPPLVRKPRRIKIPVPAVRDTTPALMLYKDASGSMPDPCTEECFGTIGGAILINSYRAAGAPVGVVLFDSASRPAYTDAREENLIRQLCSYMGGGTHVDLERLQEDLSAMGDHVPSFSRGITQEEAKNNPMLKRYLQKEGRISRAALQKDMPVDYVIITDGGIANLDDFAAYMKENKERFRPSIIHTGGFGLELQGYDGNTSGVYQGIAVYRAHAPQDIITFSKEVAKTNLLRRRARQ